MVGKGLLVSGQEDGSRELVAACCGSSLRTMARGWRSEQTMHSCPTGLPMICKPKAEIELEETT